MKKAYQQDTLEALVADQALRECRAVRVEEPPGPLRSVVVAYRSRGVKQSGLGQPDRAGALLRQGRHPAVGSRAVIEGSGLPAQRGCPLILIYPTLLAIALLMQLVRWTLIVICL